MPKFLFVGAHPDDIEIGAGGAVSRFTSEGHDVGVCILTDDVDPNMKKLRRSEAISAAGHLGVCSERVLFLGLSDGSIKSDRKTVTTFREAVETLDFIPDIIVTHSAEDAHNDHRTTNDVSRTAFRRKLILAYFVVNSSVSSFEPKFFIDTTRFQAQKHAALGCHESQNLLERILWQEIHARDLSVGLSIGTQCAEAFEIVPTQQAVDYAIDELMVFNDSPLHRLWYPLIEKRRVTYIYDLQAPRQRIDGLWPPARERAGYETLRVQFERSWHCEPPFVALSSDSPRVDQEMRTGDIFFGGGAVSNIAVRTFFNHFPGVRYVIDYDMPDFLNIRIHDKKENKQIKAQYNVLEDFKRLRVDRGILTIMKNPMANGRFIFGCMGIHGAGSFACYQLLCEFSSIRKLLTIMDLRRFKEIAGFQIIVNIDIQTEEVEIDSSSLHAIAS